MRRFINATIALFICFLFMVRVHLYAAPLEQSDVPLQPGEPLQIDYDGEGDLVIPVELNDGDLFSLQGEVSGMGSLYLRNGAGDEFPADLRIGRNEIYYIVFTAQGAPPFALIYRSNPIQAEFDTYASDTVRDDLGALTYDQPVEIARDGDQVVGWHQLDAESDALVTLFFDENPSILLYSSNYRFVRPLAELTLSDGRYAVSYRLRGESPFNFYTFQPSYSVTLQEGELLREERGALSENTMVEASPDHVAVYTLNAPENAVATISWTTIDQRTLLPDLYDADNNVVRAESVDQVDNTMIATYVLDRTPPYEVRVPSGVQVVLDSLTGDEPMVVQGTITLGAALRDTLPYQEPWLFDLDAGSGDVVTLRRTGQGVVRAQLIDNNGAILEEAARLATEDGDYAVYVLEGSPPFHVRLIGSGDFNLLAEAGDTLREMRGSLALGEVISVEVPAGRIAVYDIDFGDTPASEVTLQTVTTEAEIVAAPGSGSNVRAEGWEFSYVDETASQIYTLTGDGPYQLYVMDDSYLTVVYGGDILTASEALAMGETVMVTPGASAPFTLDAEQFDTVSITLEASSEDGVYLSVYDANHVEIRPVGWRETPESSTGAYYLSGLPPYEVSVMSVERGDVGEYALTVVEGDATREFMGVVTPGEEVTGEVAEGEIIYFELPVEAGEQFEIITNDATVMLDFWVMDVARNAFMPVNAFVRDGEGVLVYQIDAADELYVQIGGYEGGTYSFRLGGESEPADSSAASDASAESTTSAAAPECQVRSTQNVNRRATPSTTADVVGTLTGGVESAVDGQTIGANGVRWWRLADGGWVRSDVVSASGDCDDLPEVSR